MVSKACMESLVNNQTTLPTYSIILVQINSDPFQMNRVDPHWFNDEIFIIYCQQVDKSIDDGDEAVAF